MVSVTNDNDCDLSPTPFWEDVAFSEDSANRDFAKQVLEEGWIPDALYRKR